MCLSGDCDNCRAQALAASKAAEAASYLYSTKKNPPASFKLLKPQYAIAAEMLANPGQYGGIIAVLKLLAKQTEAGG